MVALCVTHLFLSSTFNLILSLELMSPVTGSLKKSNMISCLLNELFNPFTFNVIIDKAGFTSAFFTFYSPIYLMDFFIPLFVL